MDDDNINAPSDDGIIYDENRRFVKKQFGYSRIYDLEYFYPAFEKLRLDPNIMGLVSAYYGKKCFSYHALAQKSIPIPGMGQGWHYDDFEPRFKFILYMEDVDINHGPFSYIEGSNHGSLKKLRKFFHMKNGQFYKELYFKDKEVPPSKERYLTAKAGDLLLADANGIHRALKIKEGHARYAIFSFYSPNRENYKKKH